MDWLFLRVNVNNGNQTQNQVISAELSQEKCVSTAFNLLESVYFARKFLRIVSHSFTHSCTCA